MDLIPSLGLQDKAESNHAFLHINRHLSVAPESRPPADTSYYLLSTRNGPYPEFATLLRNRSAPWDLAGGSDPQHWDYLSSLHNELGFDCPECIPYSIYEGWEATEHWHHSYQAADGREKHYEYMAGINYTNYEDWTAAIWIVMLQWLDGGAGPDQMALLDPVTAVGDQPLGDARVEANGVRLAGQNPVRGVAEFEMAMASGGRATLAIFDAQGRRTRTVVDGRYEAGRHVVEWDGLDAVGRPAGSGIYFARLEWAGGHATTRCLILR